MVECHLAKVDVEGSNPFSRSPKARIRSLTPSSRMYSETNARLGASCAWLGSTRNKARKRRTTVHDRRRRASGPPPASLPLRLSGGWFGGHLIHPIDFAEFIQKLWIAIVQTDDLAKPGAVPPFVFYDFAPNFDFPKQQRRGANKIQIFFPRSDRIPT